MLLNWSSDREDCCVTPSGAASIRAVHGQAPEGAQLACRHAERAPAFAHQLPKQQPGSPEAGTQLSLRL